jgi:hypothetical protein
MINRLRFALSLRRVSDSGCPLGGVWNKVGRFESVKEPSGNGSNVPLFDFATFEPFHPLQHALRHFAECIGDFFEVRITVAG